MSNIRILGTLRAEKLKNEMRKEICCLLLFHNSFFRGYFSLLICVLASIYFGFITKAWVFLGKLFKKRKRLFVGTVPANKKLFAGTIPAN